MLKNCLKFLNAAALTNCWTHYEHICRLSYSEFRIFVKELQMVQQQFIISELSNESENTSEQASSIMHHQLEEIDSESESRKQINRQNEKIDKRDEFAVPYSRGFSGNKVSFAIFATFKHEFVLEESREYKQYLAASQSGFRVLGMSKPDYSTIMYTFLS